MERGVTFEGLRGGFGLLLGAGAGFFEGAAFAGAAEGFFKDAVGRLRYTPERCSEI